jgi:hypothetical protein
MIAPLLDGAERFRFGENEALITYIISASSPRRQHVISREVYENTWVNTRSSAWRPKPWWVFFSQYTFMGVDPNNPTDDHGIDYAEQTRNHTLINRAYSIDNPMLTAGDSVKKRKTEGSYSRLRLCRRCRTPCRFRCRRCGFL